jgi:hypothetical protein
MPGAARGCALVLLLALVAACATSPSPIANPQGAPADDCAGAEPLERSPAEGLRGWSESRRDPGSAPSTTEPPPMPPPGTALGRTPAPRNVRLHYPFRDDRFLDCQAHGWITSGLPACAEPLDFALRRLLAGDAVGADLLDPFQTSTSRASLPPLARFYRGVQLTRDGIAIVDFSADALGYLNQAACAAEAVKSSLLRTAMQLEGVRGVAFAVEGRVVDDWDG